MFTNILFPIDFSDRCAQAARYVAAIARHFNSSVTLIHAIGDYENIYTPDAPTSEAWRDWLRRNREPRMTSFGRPCLDPFVTARLIEDGEAEDVITRYAADHRIDLIAMPTHGRGLFRRLLLGSVTSKVLHDSTCPIWTTAHAEDFSASESTQIRNIVCGIDLTSESAAVFQSARKIADAYGATLRIAHAIAIPVSAMDAYMNSQFNQVLQDSATEQIANLQKQAGTAYDVSLEMGDVATVIRAAAEASHADLVVIGRGAIHEPLGRLRSNAASIIRDSPCPVLSF